MTVIARWDPFREFTTLQDRMNRLFRDSFGSEGRDEALTTTGCAPPADVYEDEHSITAKIEVPGIEEKDIDVRIENNTLTVHGERKIEKEEKEENYLRVERSLSAARPAHLWSQRNACRDFFLFRQGWNVRIRKWASCCTFPVWRCHPRTSLAERASVC